MRHYLRWFLNFSVCQSGKFNCSNDCLVPTCAANQVWEKTGKECARTCKNLHVPCLAKDSKAGCRCNGTLAWDETKNQCVQPWQCPCHYQGRSYPEGSKFKHDCNEWLVIISCFWFSLILARKLSKSSTFAKKDLNDFLKIFRLKIIEINITKIHP